MDFLLKNVLAFEKVLVTLKSRFEERLRLVLTGYCSSKHRSTYYLSCEPIIFNKIWQVCRIFSPLPWIVHVVQNVSSAGKSFITFLRNCGLELFLAATALLLGKNRIEVNNQQINWSKGCIFYSDISLKTCSRPKLPNSIWLLRKWGQILQ